MKNRHNTKNKLYIFVALAFISLGSLIAGNQDIFTQIRLGMEYFKEVYRLINRNYVDDIKPEELMKAGIEGMLKTLDPYTVFIENEEIDQLDQITTGKYGGVGMEIGRRKKKVVVITPMPDSPAKRAGILPGDVIIEIDGEATIDLSSTQVSKKLRGKVGTEVHLKIKRPVVNEVMSFTLTRAEIIINEVPFADFVAPNTVFIRLTGFSSNSASTVRRHILELRQTDKIDNLILDLRGNPGGLLQEAVEVVGFFVPEGETVVFTKGKKERQNTYSTHNTPLLPNARLVVLIDGGSASAAEIVAGAIQDLDRGVIIGEPSFGKGLVQNVFNIADGKARLKVTTARYYIPSGRCIQKMEYNGLTHQENGVIENDEKLNFTTSNGRTVLGKGGVQPDMVVEEEKNSYLETQLWRGGYFFKYSVYYSAKHSGLTLPLALEPSVTDSFYTFVRRDSFKFKIENENAYLDLIANAKKTGQNELVGFLENGESYFNQKKKKVFNENRDIIYRDIALEISQNIGGLKGRISTSMESDPQVISALKLFNNNRSYQLTLAIEHEK